MGHMDFSAALAMLLVCANRMKLRIFLEIKISMLTSQEDRIYPYLIQERLVLRSLFLADSHRKSPPRREGRAGGLLRRFCLFRRFSLATQAGSAAAQTPRPPGHQTEWSPASWFPEQIPGARIGFHQLFIGLGW